MIARSKTAVQTDCRTESGFFAQNRQDFARVLVSYRTFSQRWAFRPIQEVTVGSWDGLTHADIDAGWPGALDGAIAFDWYFRAPDGEGYGVAVERVRSWLDDADGSIVAISHGLIGRLIRGAYLGLPRDEALTLPVPQDVVWLLAQGRVEALAG